MHWPWSTLYSQQIPTPVWRNTFWNLYKFIFKLREIHLTSWHRPWLTLYSQQIQPQFGQIYLDLDKYIVKLRKIHLTSWHCWPSQLCIHNKCNHNLDTYILKFWQIYFQIKRNTSDKLTLACLVNFVFPTKSPTTNITLFSTLSTVTHIFHHDLIYIYDCFFMAASFGYSSNFRFKIGH